MKSIFLHKGNINETLKFNLRKRIFPGTKNGSLKRTESLNSDVDLATTNTCI